MKSIFVKKDKRTEAEKVYDAVLKELMMEPFGTDRYNQLLESAERLRIIVDKEKSNKMHISGDAIVTAIGSLGGIVLITAHEQLHNISTKALGFVLKGRVR